MIMLKVSRPIDWWIKWVSSIILLVSMVFRATTMFPVVDLVLSLIGVCGWFVVGLMWRDNALTILNGVSAAILFTGVLKVFGS